MKQIVIIEGQECALIPLTKGKSVIVDADMFDELSKREWYYHRKGYAAGGSGRILMHWIIGELTCGSPRMPKIAAIHWRAEIIALA